MGEAAVRYAQVDGGTRTGMVNVAGVRELTQVVAVAVVVAEAG